jgi:hypothetical protein
VFFVSAWLASGAAGARRVIRDDGAGAVGEVFAESAWGRFYRRKGAAGHPYYTAARLLARDQAMALMSGAGLRVQAARSTLCQPHPLAAAGTGPRRRGGGGLGVLACRPGLTAADRGTDGCASCCADGVIVQCLGEDERPEQREPGDRDGGKEPRKPGNHDGRQSGRADRERGAHHRPHAVNRDH